MAFATVDSWSETAASNTELNGNSTDGDVETPADVDDWQRELMSQIAKWTGDDTVTSASPDLSSVPGQYVTISGTTTITSLGTMKAGWVKYVRFSGALTLTHNGTSLILPGAANITTVAGDTAVFVSEGSGNWRCLAYQRSETAPGIALLTGTGLSSTSTDISLSVVNPKRLVINVVATSSNGTNAHLLQLGTSGGIQTSSYVSHARVNGATTTSSTAGFLIQTASASASIYGRIELDLIDASNHTWAFNGNFHDPVVGAQIITTGTKQLSAALTQFRYTTVGGTDTLDAGALYGSVMS